MVGLDIDESKVNSVNEGRSYIKHVSSTTVAEQLHANRLSASSDFSRIKDAEAVINCVPTPLGKNREPDISFIINTGA